MTDVTAKPTSDVVIAKLANRSRRSSGIIETTLGLGRKLRVDWGVDADALRRVLDVLNQR